MFVPIRVNSSKKNLNVLIAGDTATVFGLTSYMTMLPVNIFLWDTGMMKPPVKLPYHYNDDDEEKSSLCYDFNDYPPTGGVIARMDRVIAVDCDLAYPLSMVRRPALLLSHTTTGLDGTMHGVDMSEGVESLVDFIRHFLYTTKALYTYNVTVDPMCGVTISNREAKWKRSRPVKKNKDWSCLCKFSHILDAGETLVCRGKEYTRDTDALLCEKGIYELEIVIVKSRRHRRYVELTGDEHRVFDTLLEAV